MYLLESLRPTLPKKCSTKGFQEARQGQRPDQRQRGRGQRRPRRTVQASEKPQVNQQLADKSIQRRQSANRHRSNQEQQRRLGHWLGKSTHEVNLDRKSVV